MEKLLTTLGVDVHDERILQKEIIVSKILSLITFPSLQTAPSSSSSTSSSFSSFNSSSSSSLMIPKITDLGSLPILSTTSSLLLLNEIKKELEQENVSNYDYQKSYFKYLFYKQIYLQNNNLEIDKNNLDQENEDDVKMSSQYIQESMEKEEQVRKEKQKEMQKEKEVIRSRERVTKQLPSKKIITSTLCPICNETIFISSYGTIDDAVNHHIDSNCSQNSTKRKRSSRRSVPEYVEERSKPVTRSSMRKNRSITPSEIDDDERNGNSGRLVEDDDDDDAFDDFDVEENEDKDDDDVDGDDIDNDNLDDIAQDLSALRNNKMKLNPVNTSRVNDDWEEDEFQRRLLEYELNCSSIISPNEMVPNDPETNPSATSCASSSSSPTSPPTSTSSSTSASSSIAASTVNVSHNDLVRIRELKNRIQPGEIITSHGSIVEESTWNDLYEYQREGVKWMWGLYLSGGGTGGILGDEMGLGKTVQLCTHYSSIANEESYRRKPLSHGMIQKPLLLVVCPATVQHHWLQEFHRWAPRLRVVILHTISPTFSALNTMGQAAIKRAINKITQIDSNSDSESSDSIYYGVVMIVSYEGLRTLQKILLNIRWIAVTLDEGQKIKNPDANITLLCKDLPTYHRLILSGTPIQNSLKELWSLFDFVFPGRLGTLAAFESEFALPIKLGGYNNATKLQVEIAIKSATILQNMIKPYLLRRKKDLISHLINLPNKIEQVLFCMISSTQRAIYQDIINSTELQNAIRLKKPLFSIIMTLRKLCNHPILAYQLGQIKWYDENDHEEQQDLLLNCHHKSHVNWNDSGKLLVLSHILPLWKQEQHKILIFCQMYSMISLVEIMLNELSLKYMRLDGKTPVSKRQNIINYFNSNESDVSILLLTTRTGGVGISLTAANRVILVDPDWNPQIDIQARERAWRIGQKREVIIYRLITKGTIEEKIYHRQIFKLLLTNRILENPKQKRFFSKHDIQELFELESFENALPADMSLELSLDHQDMSHHQTADNNEIEEGEVAEIVINPENISTIDSTIATLTQFEQKLIQNRSVAASASSSSSTPASASTQDSTNVTQGQENSGDRDHQLLRALYDGEAITAVYDHSYFEGNNNKDKYGTQRKQEDQIKQLAKKVVDEAVKQLRNSNTAYGENSSSRVRLGIVDTGASGGRSSQRSGRFSSTPSSSSSSSSSSSMLAGLRQLQGRTTVSNTSSTITSSPNTSTPLSTLSSSTEGHMTSSVLIRLQNIFQQRPTPDGLTTEEILGYFSDLPDQFAPIFREMLRRVAIFSEGRWKLLNE